MHFNFCRWFILMIWMSWLHVSSCGNRSLKLSVMVALLTFNSVGHFDENGLFGFSFFLDFPEMFWLNRNLMRVNKSSKIYLAIQSLNFFPNILKIMIYFLFWSIPLLLIQESFLSGSLVVVRFSQKIRLVMLIHENPNETSVWVIFSFALYISCLELSLIVCFLQKFYSYFMHTLEV